MENTSSKDEIDSSTIPMTFRHSSIRSSMSSLYRNFEIHLDILKLTGVVVLLSIMSVTLALTGNIYSREKSQNTTMIDCIRSPTIYTRQQLYMSLCSYIKQYPLPGDYYVTICTYQSNITVDVRFFLNGKPTIKGFFLNTNQYRYFKRLIPHIDKAIKTARKRQQ